MSIVMTRHASSSRPPFSRSITPLSAALALVLLTAESVPAMAQQSGAPSASVLPEVQVQGTRDDYAPAAATVGAKVPTALRDIPQSVTVVNRAVLDAQGATTLTDALRNVPGITISAGEGGQIGDNINLRGYSARTDLFLDGMRDRGQYVRETFFVESVEVLKGPSSLFFGRGSTGGVINRVSKLPDLRAKKEVGLTVGTDAYYRATADINQPLSQTSALRVSGLAHTSASTRDVVEAERYGVAPSLRFGIGTPTTVTLSAVSQRTREVPDYGFPIVNGKPLGAAKEAFYGFTDDAFDQDTDTLSARIDHKISSTLSVRNHTQWMRTQMQASPTTITSAGVRSRRDREVEDSALINQTDLIAKFDTGQVKHTLIAGLELARDQYDNQGYTWTNVPSQSLAVPPEYRPMPASATRTINATRVETDADTLAVYVNEQAELGKHWKLVGGLRWDRFKAESQTVNNASGAITLPLAQTDKMTSGRAGVIFQPTDTQSYYLAYGTSFNPSAEAITMSVPNTGIDPEKNHSLEVGAKLDFLSGALSFNTAVFRVQKNKARQTDPVSGMVLLAGDTRVDGIELGVNGRLSPNWQVLAGYTYLEGEILKSILPGEAGKVLPNTPKQSASVWSTYRFAPGWEIGGGLVYASDRFVNNLNTAQIDSYTRYDATLAYYQKAYDVRLNLQNIGDKQYFEVGSGSRATPARGRTASVSVNYRF